MAAHKGFTPCERLDGKSVLFVGNSFTFFGDCVLRTTRNGLDNGYFYRVAESYGDHVTVTNCTYGGYSFYHIPWQKYAGKELLTLILALHPNHYGNKDSAEIDPFYLQDYVVLQQSGMPIPETYDDARAIMALFPPETQFLFYVTTHDVFGNLEPTLAAAEALRSEGVGYIPLGQMLNDVWNGKALVPGATLPMNKNSFIIDGKDQYHPNCLTGLLTAIMTYCTITGAKATLDDTSFVSTELTHYFNGPTNFPEILASKETMRGLCALVDRYIAEYNPERG